MGAVEQLDAKVQQLDAKVDQLDARVVRLEQGQQRHEQRSGRLEVAQMEMMRDQGQMRKEMNYNHDKIMRRMEDVRFELKSEISHIAEEARHQYILERLHY